MNCQNPFKISDIDIDKIFFKNIKESENKKIIFIKYKDDNLLRNMVFQLPTLINELRIHDKEIEIPINCENEEKTEKVLKLLEDIDNKIIFEAKKN